MQCNAKSTRKLGIGTVQFGFNYGISNAYGQTSQAEAASILNYAKEKEIKILDTAAVYGTSETVLGKNNLDSFDIVSKFLVRDNQNSISAQLQNSLLKLNVGSLYGFLAHKPMDVVKNPDIWRELHDLKEKKYIKKTGFSFNEVSELDKVLSLDLIPDLIQVPFNYLDNRFEPYMKYLKENGCEIHSRSVFLQGLFFADIENLNSFFNDLRPIVHELRQFGDDLPGMLIKYCTNKPFIDKVIFGVNNLNQLKNNIRGISVKKNLPLNPPFVNETLLIPSKWPK